MKKLIAGLLAALCLLGLTGCAQPEPAVPEAIEPQVLPEVSPEPADPAEPESKPDPLPVEPAVPAQPEPAPVEPADPEAFFNGSLFLGDSILEGIRQYVAMERKNGPTLGDARFIASTAGVSIRSLSGSDPQGPQYRFRGQDRTLLSLCEELAPKKVFLLLGLNDLAAEDPDLSAIVENYMTLVGQIREVLPDSPVYILKNPPKVRSAWLPDYTANRDFGNRLIGDFVEALAARCQEEAIPCIDLHGALSDENGFLPDDWCRDGYVHLNNRGSAAAVEALYRFAEKEN